MLRKIRDPSSPFFDYAYRYDGLYNVVRRAEDVQCQS